MTGWFVKANIMIYDFQWHLLEEDIYNKNYSLFFYFFFTFQSLNDLFFLKIFAADALAFISTFSTLLETLTIFFKAVGFPTITDIVNISMNFFSFVPFGESKRIFGDDFIDGLGSNHIITFIFAVITKTALR